MTLYTPISIQIKINKKPLEHYIVYIYVYLCFIDYIFKFSKKSPK